MARALFDARGAAACALAVLLASTSWAHKAHLWATVSGGEVICRGSVGRGARAKHCRITAYLPDGKVLVRGKTDDEGRFSFVPGVCTDMRVVLDAGEGHRAEFRLAADQLRRVAPSARPSCPTPPPPPAPPAPSSPSLDETALRRIVADVVDRTFQERVEPVLDQMAALADRKPGPTEIIGGIGYILGIMGVVMYFRGKAMTRKTQDRP